MAARRRRRKGMVGGRSLKGISEAQIIQFNGRGGGGEGGGGGGGERRHLFSYQFKKAPL